MQTPIDGEPGIGYIMRRGYDLPPLNFDLEEIDALHGPADWLQVAPWGAPKDDPEMGCVPFSLLRDCIRREVKLRLTYRKDEKYETSRIVRPVALIYHVECVMLAARCELRASFRHFCTDRIYGCDVLEDDFTGEGEILRNLWFEQYQIQESARS